MRTKNLWIIIATILSFNIVYNIGQWGGEIVLQIISDSLPILCSLIAVFCLISTVRSFKEMDFTRVAWILILIGISLNFVAETTYSVLEVVYKIDMNNYFPSPADIFWCTGYLPLITGLAMMFWGYKQSGFPMGKKYMYIIISVVFVALFLAVGNFLLIPILKDSETGVLTKFFYMYYPVADLIVLVPAVILMYITSLFGKGIISTPWRMLSIGFLFFTIADLSYSYLGWLDLYKNGNPIEILWNAAYLVIGLAGLYQKQLLESIK